MKKVDPFKVRKSRVNPTPPVYKPAKPGPRKPRPENPKPKNQHVKLLAERANMLLLAIAEYKEYYKQLDKICETLKYVPNEVLVKYGIEVADNFKDENVSWKSVGIRRFELKRVG